MKARDAPDRLVPREVGALLKKLGNLIGKIIRNLGFVAVFPRLLDNVLGDLARDAEIDR